MSWRFRAPLWRGSRPSPWRQTSSLRFCPRARSRVLIWSTLLQWSCTCHPEKGLPWASNQKTIFCTNTPTVQLFLLNPSHTIVIKFNLAVGEKHVGFHECMSEGVLEWEGNKDDHGEIWGERWRKHWEWEVIDERDWNYRDPPSQIELFA